MPLFVCSNCNGVDNTALAWYWGHEDKPLCAECAPAEFGDGEPTGLGIWHGRFEKRAWNPETEPLRPGTRMLMNPDEVAKLKAQGNG